MAACECVLLRVGDVFLRGEALERRQHAAARLLRRIEERDTSLVGCRFLLAALGEQRAHDHLVAAEEDALAGAAEIVGSIAARDATGDDEAEAENLR